MAEPSIPRITEDRREIVGLWKYDGRSGPMLLHRTGFRCEKIKAYSEIGEMPWIAVYVDDQIRWRIPAHMVTVEYAAEGTDQ